MYPGLAWLHLLVSEEVEGATVHNVSFQDEGAISKGALGVGYAKVAYLQNTHKAHSSINT